HIATTDNMLVEHAIPVRGLLWSENDLLVRIRPTAQAARAYPISPLSFAGPGRYESLHVRKAAHMFGWDIFPRIVSAGLWRPVSLRFLPRTRIETAYLETQSIAADRSSARLVLHWHAHGPAFDGARSMEIEVVGTCGEATFREVHPALFSSGRFAFTVADPRLWWPRGRGAQDLYVVSVVLRIDGVEVDRLEFHHGIRTARLDRTSVVDADGNGKFEFVINGERTFILGTNWVPTDALTGRQSERIPAAIQLAVECGCNLLRVWGGGVYEPDRFYDLCDRHGLLVWQDFAMGCAVYPQDDGFRARIKDEAGKVVRRLRQHPCIVLWAGDNECDQAWSWGGVPQDPNDNVLTRVDLPAVLRSEDPLRPWLPSSPCIDREAFAAGEKYLSESHLWGPRNYYKGEYYTSALARFVSEIGYHGCPDPSSLRKFLTPDRLWPYHDNPEWILHSTSPIPGIDLYDYRVELMAKQIRCLFGEVPDTLDAYALASQTVQAEAMKFFIERFRMDRATRSGIVWWNLLDGWPQLSDAVVDYYFVKKLAFRVIRRVQQPLVLSVEEPVDGKARLIACSERRDPATIAWTVTDVATGESVGADSGTAPGEAATALGVLPMPAGAQRLLRIDWRGDVEGTNHYLAGEPPFDFQTVAAGLRLLELA
ncbi:MAG: glycosyl hydrolase 2 galactose-binding domain-containing protein, partial [Armatimonadota bacterium]